MKYYWMWEVYSPILIRKNLKLVKKKKTLVKLDEL